MGHYYRRLQLLIKYVSAFAYGEDCALVLQAGRFREQTLRCIILYTHEIILGAGFLKLETCQACRVALWENQLVSSKHL